MLWLHFLFFIFFPFNYVEQTTNMSLFPFYLKNWYLPQGLTPLCPVPLSSELWGLECCPAASSIVPSCVSLMGSFKGCFGGDI